jgi:hypothetical protein
MGDDDSFDWSKDNEDIVVEWQGAIAVYRNSSGGIVVRQEAQVDEDQFVVIQPTNLRALIRRLEQVAAEIIADEAIERSQKQ